MTADPAPGPTPPEFRLVTISAAYGAGGSVVAPGLAQRLGVPFLQRVTTNEGLVPDCEPCGEMLTADEASSTPVHRLLASLTHAMPVGPTQSPLPTHLIEQDMRTNAEAGIRRQAGAGHGGGLGRAGPGRRRAASPPKTCSRWRRLSGPPRYRRHNRAAPRRARRS